MHLKKGSILRTPGIALVACCCIFVGCASEEAPDVTATPSEAAVKVSPVRTTAPPKKTVRFDPEAWRRETIKIWGPEREYQDGSKLDYVKVARAICAAEDRPEYEEDSIQEYMIETFCPYD
jgi:hypothetical protein